MRVLHGVNQGKLVESLGDGGAPAASLPPGAADAAASANLTLTTASFAAAPEQLRPPRVTRIALLQHAHPASPSAPFADQRAAAHARLEAGARAAAAGAQLLCTQECWTMPFGFCTREKAWCEFAECAAAGPSTALCARLARETNMAIISCILERDEANSDTVWNTAVVVGPRGNVVGKHRKNHIPRVGDFNESTYYMEGGEERKVGGGGSDCVSLGFAACARPPAAPTRRRRGEPLPSSPSLDTGHPVFDLGPTIGRVAVNICYGRHHPLNWMGFALNGAEIVLNPCATTAGLSEALWPVEGRNAAIANGVYVACVNRVGTETFPRAFTSGDGRAAHSEFGHFYGSSYVAAPDGSRSRAAPRGKDALVVADCDRNLCRQVRDWWGFQATARLPLYAALLARATAPGFVPQIVRDQGPASEGDRGGAAVQSAENGKR